MTRDWMRMPLDAPLRLRERREAARRQEAMDYLRSSDAGQLMRRIAAALSHDPDAYSHETVIGGRP